MGGGRTWKVDCTNMNYTLRALSKSQSRLARTMAGPVILTSNKLFPRIFAETLLLRARYLRFD